MKIHFLEGGKGSGNFGHAGRNAEDKRGGSAPSSGNPITQWEYKGDTSKWYQPAQIGTLAPEDTALFDSTVEQFLQGGTWKKPDIKDIFLYNPEYRKQKLTGLMHRAKELGLGNSNGSVTVFYSGVPSDSFVFSTYTLNQKVAEKWAKQNGLPVRRTTFFAPAIIGYHEKDDSVFVMPAAFESKGR